MQCIDGVRGHEWVKWGQPGVKLLRNPLKTSNVANAALGHDATDALVKIIDLHFNSRKCLTLVLNNFCPGSQNVQQRGKIPPGISKFIFLLHFSENKKSNIPPTKGVG